MNDFFSPKNCRDNTGFPEQEEACLNHVVKLKHKFANARKEIFKKGALMIIESRYKETQVITLRSLKPLTTRVVLHESDVTLLGTKKDNGITESQ